jgi:hypothetical protein
MAGEGKPGARKPARIVAARKPAAKKLTSNTSGTGAARKTGPRSAKSVVVRDGSGGTRSYTLGGDVDLDRETVRDSRGRRVTNAYAEAAAADALRRAGRGRPALTGGRPGAGSPQVTFRLPAKLKAEAERRAQAEGKKVSQLAREALERYLA